MQFWILAPEAVFFCPVVSFGTRQLVYVRVLTDLCAREYGMYVCMYVCIVTVPVRPVWNQRLSRGAEFSYTITYGSGNVVLGG
jgi:hypothetical protein